MKIQLLLTGNELMSGHTVDSNSAMMAEQLAAQGFTINRKVTVGDAMEQLVEEIQQLAVASDILLVNGGLGPTVDDLTAQALSQVTGQALEDNAVALAHLRQWCGDRKLALSEANLKQAHLPAGITIIPNATGSAVGFSIEHEQCLIICTPGVPSELRLMLEQSIVPLLSQRFPNHRQPSTIRFQTFGLGESSLQQLIQDDYGPWPEAVELGFRAGMPLLEVKLTVADPQDRPLQQQCYTQLQGLIADYIVGEESTNLAQATIELLQAKGQTVTTAESCTGGLIAAAITEISGASTVFEAGFVTYSNTMKQQLIGVPENLIAEHGAVSEEVVRAMATGALARSGADYAVAVSGIAGPDGGTEEKPVGTVWIAWGSQETLKSYQLRFNAPRKWFQEMVTATSLDLLRRELLNIDGEPRYFRYRGGNKKTI